MAPELLLGKDYNESVDVFSFGKATVVLRASCRQPHRRPMPQGILLCELIGRIAADPDIMPRTDAFGIDESAFRTKFAADCPEPLLALAFHCAQVKPKVGGGRV